jgi:phage terminase large subunit GpA-like protein
MDAISDPLIREIWCMKSAQVGWTEVLNNCIGYFVDQDPSPIMIVQPTQDAAEDWSRDRLAPMIRDTPCLAGKFSEDKSRKSTNTLRHKTFPGGLLAVAISNSPSSLASKPIRVALFDEVDKYPPSARHAGDPIGLGRKRTTAFWNRKILVGSTPTVKGASRVEKGFEGSDQRFYFVPCPHCREFQRLIWTQVKWKEVGLDPAQAVYQCEKCGELIAHHQKPQMLRLGEWRSTKPFNGIAGFHISELYSPWSSWGDMAVSFVEARPLPETFQQWINESLGETWEEAADKIETSTLSGRVESYTSAGLPPGVLLLTAGTDVQDDRIEIYIYGWGADEECWRVEHIVLRGDPGSKALWDEHDDILRRRFRTDDGRELLIESCCVDSGGHYTEQVYRYCLKRKKYRVWAIKGVAGQGKPAWPKKAGRGKIVAVALWLIGVDTIKALIYGRLKKVTSAGPGYLHFDAAADDEYFDQLTSEVSVTKLSQGRRVTVWKPKKLGVRQEALDCAVYAYAAMQGRGGAELLAARSKRAQPVPEDKHPDPTIVVSEEAPASDVPKLEPAPVRRVNRFRGRNWTRNWK